MNKGLIVDIIVEVYLKTVVGKIKDIRNASIYCTIECFYKLLEELYDNFPESLDIKNEDTYYATLNGIQFELIINNKLENEILIDASGTWIRLDYDDKVKNVKIAENLTTDGRHHYG